jgi:hypothetical protein
MGALDISSINWDSVAHSHELSYQHTWRGIESRYGDSGVLSLPKLASIINCALNEGAVKNAITEALDHGNPYPFLFPYEHNAISCTTVAIWTTKLCRDNRLEEIKSASLWACLPRQGCSVEPHGFALLKPKKHFTNDIYFHLTGNNVRTYAEIADGRDYSQGTTRTYPSRYLPDKYINFLYDIAAGLQQYYEIMKISPESPRYRPGAFQLF